MGLEVARVCLSGVVAQVQGWRDEAPELLVGIYYGFSKGFDTVDLMEAKALLEEIERAH